MSVSKLREAIGEKDDDFAEGEVIRWTSGGRFTYAAVKAGGRWWISGNGTWYGGHVFDFEALVKILGRSDVTNVEVADPDAWSPV